MPKYVLFGYLFEGPYLLCIRKGKKDFWVINGEWSFSDKRANIKPEELTLLWEGDTLPVHESNYNDNIRLLLESIKHDIPSK